MGLTAATLRRIHFSGSLFLQVLACASALPTDFTAPDRFRSGLRIHRGTEVSQPGFPAAWTGVWFQSGIDGTISVNTTAIQSKGVLVQQKADKLIDKYLLHDEDLQCHRCLEISSPHRNVLQYRESYCEPSEQEEPNFEQLCKAIGRDTQFSMFRVDAPAEECPQLLRGRFAFTYSQAQRRCESPVSSAESCVKGTEMMIQYKSCPDKTEERKVRLECQGSWSISDGQVYLVARTFHHMATSNEETYRCFIYEYDKAKDQIRMAQSADASCTGFYSPTQDDAMAMVMTPVKDPRPGCTYPTWLTSVRQWHDMASTQRYVFDSPTQTSLRQFSLNATSEKELLLDATCLRQDMPGGAEDDTFRAVVFVARGCTSGYMCLNWRKRSDQVVQLQQGRFSSAAELACSEDYLSNQTEWTTLVAAEPRAVPCPFPGQYLVPTPHAKCGTVAKVTIGCHKNTAIHFVPHPENGECTAEHEEETPMHFTCHGDWRDKNVGYFVTSERDQNNSVTNHCFVYQEEDGVLRLVSVPRRCPTSLDSGEQFNVTGFSKCEVSDSSGHRRTVSWLLPVLLAIAVHFLPR